MVRLRISLYTLRARRQRGTTFRVWGTAACRVPATFNNSAKLASRGRDFAGLGSGMFFTGHSVVIARMGRKCSTRGPQLHKRIHPNREFGKMAYANHARVGDADVGPRGEHTPAMARPLIDNTFW